MGESTRQLRLRSIVSSWFGVLLAVLLVCTIVGGYATAIAYISPGTTTEERTVEQWGVTGGFEHSATVTRENPVFPMGAELSDRSTYFSSASPVLDGRFELRHTPAGAAPLSVTTDAALVLRSIESEGNTVLWRDQVPLATNRAQSVAAGDTAGVSFSINASRVAERQAAIQESLGDAPGEIETAIVVNATASGTVNGEPTTLTFTQRLPLTVSGSTYTVGETSPVSETATSTRIVTVPKTYGPLWRLGGPLLLLVGLVGTIGLAVARYRTDIELTESEREQLDFADDRSEFDDWVVQIDLEDVTFERPLAEAESLRDLVDFAIDSDVGVVEDVHTGQFYALTPDLVAVYEPPHPSGAELTGVAELTEEPVADIPEVNDDADDENVAE